MQTSILGGRSARGQVLAEKIVLKPIYVVAAPMAAAVAILFMSDWFGVAAAALVGVAGLMAAYALCLKLTRRASPGLSSCRLLRPAGRRAVGSVLALPDKDHQRRLLSRALSDTGSRVSPDGAPTRGAVRARLLRRFLTLWGRQSVADLAADEVLDLFALYHLVEADNVLAGSLAHFFHRPADVLALRDKLNTFERGETSCQQDVTLTKTGMLWHAGQAAGTMVGLEALGVADPDLWHRVVLAHDPNSDASRATAQWCVRQPGCDRTTVAVYLADVARNRALSAAAGRGDRAFCEGIARILQQWRDGVYADRGIGLADDRALAGAGAALARELDALARITGAPRLPDPKGLFAPHQGRPPHPRPAWCPSTGLLISPPRPSDYLSGTAEAA